MADGSPRTNIFVEVAMYINKGTEGYWLGAVECHVYRGCREEFEYDMYMRIEDTVTHWMPPSDLPLPELPEE